MPDFTSLLPASLPFAHFLEFFCIFGTPQNNDRDRPVSVIVNHGYAVGFSDTRLQPAWAAYQVSAAKRDVDYERPDFFYEDPRLPEPLRIGTAGYRRLGDVRYDRGHMVPNFAINTQFGRVAQNETFFMSNIAPQRSDTNQGGWERLEKAIARAYAPVRKHVWAMVGPIFGPNPREIERQNGLRVPVADSFFLIVADPERYPYDDPDNLNLLVLRMPQEWGRAPLSDDLVSTLPEIEAATGLTFFPRLTASQKAKLVNQTSPFLWPFEIMADRPGEPPVPVPPSG